MKILKTPCRKLSVGFTLIELLVVIAIIAILAALLLPSLAAAKDRAQAVTDLNNHRQILLATHMYCSDNGDQLPDSGWKGTGYTSWANGLPFTGGHVTTEAQYKINYQQEVNEFMGLGPNEVPNTNNKPCQLYNYLRFPKVYLCPADVPNALTYNRGQFFSSYIWNGAVDGYIPSPVPATEKPYKLLDFRRPDCILMWENDETLTASGQWNDFSNYPDEGISGRHGKTGTVGCFDGSSSRMNLRNFYLQAAGSTTHRVCTAGTGYLYVTNGLPNQLWCRPGSGNGR